MFEIEVLSRPGQINCKHSDSQRGGVYFLDAKIHGKYAHGKAQEPPLPVFKVRQQESWMLLLVESVLGRQEAPQVGLQLGRSSQPAGGQYTILTRRGQLPDGGQIYMHQI